MLLSFFALGGVQIPAQVCVSDRHTKAIVKNFGENGTGKRSESHQVDKRLLPYTILSLLRDLDGGDSSSCISIELIELITEYMRIDNIDK